MCKTHKQSQAIPNNNKGLSINNPTQEKQLMTAGHIARGNFNPDGRLHNMFVKQISIRPKFQTAYISSNIS